MAPPVLYMNRSVIFENQGSRFVKGPLFRGEVCGRGANIKIKIVNSMISILDAVSNIR